MRLTSFQLATAGEIWADFSADMAELQTSRQGIIRSIAEKDQAHSVGQRSGSAWSQSELTVQLLDDVARLKQNAAIQQEIVATMHRTFLLRICCPHVYGRLIAYFWPYHPDITRLLHQVAQGSDILVA